MKNELTVIPEPLLQFRYSQKLVAPHDGLALFGPYDSEQPSHPASLSYAVIGTQEGLTLAESFFDAIKKPIVNDSEKIDLRLWPNFPGYEVTYHSKFPDAPTMALSLDSQSLTNSSMLNDPHQRASKVVEHYLEKIKVIADSDKNVSVIVCIVPEIVHKNCRPKSTIKDGLGDKITSSERKIRASGQTSLFDSYDPETYQFSVDFRRQLKGRAMEYGIPIQIIRESTLRLEDSETRGERGLTTLSDRAWNLTMTMFYKAGGQPWKLATARDGVCYVGLVFRQLDPGSNSGSACCAAQMFLDSGDGVVFRGQDGRWYSQKDKAYHLSESAAHNLLSGLLKAYNDLGGQPLTEIFLHCHSSIDSEEFKGFQRACPEGVKLVGIRVRQERSGLRMFREGKLPVMRGSFWEIDKRTAYLWGTGYKPKISNYDGWETPAPLRIDIQHGSADIKQVAEDILALTKLNYNSCKMGDSEPVTIGFSDAVGEILVSNPTIKNPSAKFKFYI
jgi:hypothetical protein